MTITVMEPGAEKGDARHILGLILGTPAVCRPAHQRSQAPEEGHEGPTQLGWPALPV